MRELRDDASTALVRALGVPSLEPATVPFDPGYDPRTVESHLEQSSHLMAMLKLSMASWIIADDAATRAKVDAAHRHRVPVLTGGGPFEIAAAQRLLPEYLDLCAEVGVDCVEAGEGFTDLPVDADEAVRMAVDRGLALQFELGKKHGGAFDGDTVAAFVDQGRRWLDAGACRLVVEARESANDVGLFGADGVFDGVLADRLADALGPAKLVFEAPTKASQFALLDHFGPSVILGNVRLEELLRVEIYRRGLHADAFGSPRLAPVLV